MNINDYSVLLGISELRGGALEGDYMVKNGHSFEHLYSEGIINKFQEMSLKRASAADLSDSNSRIDTEANQEDVPMHEKERPEKAFFESHDGGLVS